MIFASASRITLEPVPVTNQYYAMKIISLLKEITDGLWLESNSDKRSFDYKAVALTT